MYKLREYQEKTVQRMLTDLELPGNSIISAAQGSGKSIILSEFARRYGKPILILQPNKELTIQNAEKIKSWANAEDVGIYSASLNKKEIKPITLATIGSIYKKADLFKNFKVVIIDEADLAPVSNKNSMYMKLLLSLDKPKVFGMTGTPFRQSQIYKKWGKEKWQVETITVTKMINRVMTKGSKKRFFWSRMLVVINTDDLTNRGYLTPLKYHDNSYIEHSQIPVNKSRSNFDLELFHERLSEDIESIAERISSLRHASKLVFCASVEQAEDLHLYIDNSVVVTSGTNKADRQRAVIDFKSGKVSTLLNVGIYTVGFDYPELNCLVLLRPLKSIRLHCQILGRATRKAEGKEFGHIYDFVGNIASMGTLESVRVVRIEGRWNVISSSYPGGMHYVPLYKYKLQNPAHQRMFALGTMHRAS